MNFWRFDEFKLFNSAVDDTEYRTFFNFLYWTGCRHGEALTLTWNDFTSGFSSVKIKNYQQKIAGKPYEITPPKILTSDRYISLQNSL